MGERGEVKVMVEAVLEKVVGVMAERVVEGVLREMEVVGRVTAAALEMEVVAKVAMERVEVEMVKGAKEMVVVEKVVVEKEGAGVGMGWVGAVNPVKGGGVVGCRCSK
jgi:hypothetical protein